MKVTNKLNLPDAIVKAVTKDSYTKGDADISVTSLISPPQIEALKVKHADELIEDASDLIYSLLGQVMHGILERAETVAIPERRLSIEVDGWKISGGMDRYEALALEGGKLQDYKLTSLYKVKDGATEEWTQQLNIYAEMLRQNGQSVTELEIVAILRDWTKGKAQRDEKLPQTQVVVVPVPLIPSEQVMEFIRTRIAEHKAARAGNARECTPEEMWADPSVTALMKKGRKSAVRLYENREVAEANLKIEGAEHYLVDRPGVNKRCVDWCPVKAWCPQYNKGEKK